jgi:hypothetical protein
MTVRSQRVRQSPDKAANISLRGAFSDWRIWHYARRKIHIGAATRAPSIRVSLRDLSPSLAGVRSPLITHRDQVFMVQWLYLLASI